MAYLFFQIWAWLLLAFILGLLLGGFFCWLCCRNKKYEYTQQVKSEPVKQTQSFAEPVSTPEPVPEVKKPIKKVSFLSEAPADIDDLKRIKGVGAVLEKTLNELGIYQFKQIAAFTRDQVEWVDDSLSFPGRIDREEWIDQAKKLSAGIETEFSKRVDHGDVEY